MKKIIPLFIIGMMYSCGQNNDANSPANTDTSVKDSILSNEPVQIEDGIIVYEGDTFYSREKALQISETQKKQSSVSACDEYVGNWTKSDNTLLVIKNNGGSYVASLSHPVLGNITEWYLKCGSGDYPELVPIGSGATLILLPSGELEMRGRGDGRPYHRR